VALQFRFERSGNLTTSTRPSIYTGSGGSANSYDHPYLGMYLSNFGLGLSSPFGRTGTLGDLDEAIDLLARQWVPLLTTPTSPLSN